MVAEKVELHTPRKPFIEATRAGRMARYAALVKASMWIIVFMMIGVIGLI